MARLGAQALAGFYAASERAITQLVKHLQCKPLNPDKPRDTVQVLDPCAGEGLAVKQIAEALGIPNEKVYCIELDAGRTERIKENIPGCQLLGPASFFGSMITGCSFGIAYVNPPFDTDLFAGGGREELKFAEEATKKLVPLGVLVLVCPINALIGRRSFVEFLDAHFEDLGLYKFPDGERPYREIVVFGRKRRQSLPISELSKHGTLHQMQCHYGNYITLDRLPPLGDFQPKSYQNGQPSYEREEHIRTWEVPTGWAPSTWKKTEFTDDELAKAVADSPLNTHLREVVERPPDRPPLPLDKGHLGLMLASGKLDGVVHTPFGAHVVRGSCHKVEYHNKEQSQSTENPDTGAVTTKDVFSERPVTIARMVDQRGIIWTHSTEVSEQTVEEDKHEYE